MYKPGFHWHRWSSFGDSFWASSPRPLRRGDDSWGGPRGLQVPRRHCLGCLKFWILQCRGYYTSDNKKFFTLGKLILAYANRSKSGRQPPKRARSRRRGCTAAAVEGEVGGGDPHFEALSLLFNTSCDNLDGITLCSLALTLMMKSEVWCSHNSVHQWQNRHSGTV